jgi:DNA-binding MarR family transcriptional regulator
MLVISEWLRTQPFVSKLPGPMSKHREPRAEDLRHAMQQLFRRFGALAADSTPCGKPLSIAHAHALMVLAEKGELSQRELALELSIDKSNVTRLCTKMVESHHLEQRQCDRDGRSKRVRLTAAGERLARDVDAASRDRFDALLAALPARRQRHVLEALKELVAALDALPGGSPDERKST